ncbi:MFS transporter small subunit [Nocardiopsis coralli]|nr:hypothetical protein [Nocardiopsis coralli]
MTEARTKLSSKIAALVLWAIVGAALLYGVVQTAMQAAALFTS